MVKICDGKEEKYCRACGDEIKYHQMDYGCAVVHEGSECEGSCRCGCLCVPCCHKAVVRLQRQSKRVRKIMSEKQYIRPLEDPVGRIKVKEKIKVSTRTRK